MTADPTPHALAHHGLKRVRYRTGDATDLRLPENLARFLHRRIVDGHHGHELMGAFFVDADVHPLAYTRHHLEYDSPANLDPRRLLAPGLVVAAAGLILYHHRPEGDLSPNDDDLELAMGVRAAGEVVGVRLLDHLLLGREDRWVSLRRDRHTRFLSLGDPVTLPMLAVAAPRVDRRRIVKPKYVSPERPEQTWSGRGRMARWLKEKIEAGGRLEDFAAEE